MEAREPLKPGWPRVRVMSAGMGYPPPAPSSDRSSLAPAQITVVIEGAKFVTGTVSA